MPNMILIIDNSLDNHFYLISCACFFFLKITTGMETIKVNKLIHTTLPIRATHG